MNNHTVPLPDGLVWDLDLGDHGEIEALSSLVWPRYLLEPGDLPDDLPQESPEGRDPATIYHAWGIRRSGDHHLVAATTALSLHVDPTATSLPEEGWGYAARACLLDIAPNALSLLSAAVDPELRRLGLSRMMLEQGKALAALRNRDFIIAPVRPSAKERHPYLSMEEYLYREGGIDSDPWLRTHRELGGEVLNICSRSVVVRAGLERWREWTGESYTRSGEYLLPMGLVPLRVDVDNDIGTYTEPNVWVRYTIGK